MQLAYTYREEKLSHKYLLVLAYHQGILYGNPCIQLVDRGGLQNNCFKAVKKNL